MKRIGWNGIASLAVLVLLSGCKEGSGLANLFGGGGSDSADVVIIAGGDSGSGDGSFSESVATVHNPEPSSLALFGLGLAGLARNRKKRRAA
jgi:hypothetical protein